MKYNKLLILLFIPLFFSIVKADGCGLTCPKGSHNHMEFALILVCNLFTWSFCHIFSFFASVIIVVIIFIFWYIQPSERKKKVKYLIYALTGIVVFILFYPYIRAFTQTTPSVPTTTTIPFDSCYDYDTTDCSLLGVGVYLEHTAYYSYNYWGVACPSTSISSVIISVPIGVNVTGIDVTPVFIPPNQYQFYLVGPEVYAHINVTNYTIGLPYTITIEDCLG